MTKKGDIEQLGKEAQENVLKWNVEGVTAQEISDRLNSTYQTDLNSNTVWKYIARFRSKSVKLIKDDDKLQKDLMGKYFDTINQLNKLNQEAWKMLYEIKKDPEFKSKSIPCPHCHKSFTISLKSYGNQLKSMETIMGQIKHVDSVLGKMSKKQLNITYNVLDLRVKLQKVLPELLDSLESRGIAKINRKKLKQFYN
jgi:hypothetical protein